MKGLNDRDLAMVLASLRHMQKGYAHRGDVPAHVAEIATNGGQFAPLDGEEIDDLCERLNVEDSGVDVLAVLDGEIADRRRDGDTGNVENLIEAGNAMAGLMAKAECVEAWIVDYVPDDVGGREVELRELRAALAGVKGGAA